MSEPQLTSLPGPEDTTKDETVNPSREKKPRGRAAVKIRLETLETEVSDRIVEYVAVPIGMISPLGAAVLDQRAERTSKALCRIAATSPRMRKALERFVQGSAMADLGGTFIAVSIAIGVDMRRIEPLSMPARFANIPELYPQVYPGEQFWQFSKNGHSESDEPRGFAFEDEE